MFSMDPVPHLERLSPKIACRLYERVSDHETRKNTFLKKFHFYIDLTSKFLHCADKRIEPQLLFCIYPRLVKFSHYWRYKVALTLSKIAAHYHALAKSFIAGFFKVPTNQQGNKSSSHNDLPAADDLYVLSNAANTKRK